MHVTAPHETIAALWQVLTKPNMGALPEKVAKISREAVALGWLDLLTIEAIVTAMDPHLHEIRTQYLLDAFGIRRQMVFPQPGSNSSDPDGFEMVAAIDVTYLLTLLERSGFAVDPIPLYEPFLPVINERRYIGAIELAVYRHAKERHRLEPVVIATRPDLELSLADETITTPAGYVAGLFRNAERQPYAMRVMAPLWYSPLRPVA